MTQVEPTPAPREARRKPRLALMGEFSAGKSTLSNILIGRAAIPTKVTATHLPPVWIAHGSEAPYREDLEGNRHPLNPTRLEDVPIEETAFIRLFVEAEVLEVCDLIDTPGISDPNMPPEVWQRAADVADGVIWLTHATQAWRQSEAATWSALPSELRATSLLLITRIDKMVNEKDRRRVIARVESETAGQFRKVLPIALNRALEAGDDAVAWDESGGAALSEALLNLIADLDRKIRMSGEAPRQRMQPVFTSRPAGEPVRQGGAPLRVVPRDEPPGPVAGGNVTPLPRRVVPTGEGRTERPARPRP